MWTSLPSYCASTFSLLGTASTAAAPAVRLFAVRTAQPSFQNNSGNAVTKSASPTTTLLIESAIRLNQPRSDVWVKLFAMLNLALQRVGEEILRDGRDLP